MAGAEAVPIRKRPAAECLDKVCKRPATASHQEEESDLEQESDVEEDHGSEDPEEETDCEIDEIVSSEPEDRGRIEDGNPLMNMVVKTQSLNNEACDDKVCWVRQQRQDGRLFLEEIPEGEQIWVLPEKVLTLSKVQMMAAFATSMDIGPQTFSIRPWSQGDRGCQVRVVLRESYGWGKQFGMCSENLMDGDISRAFAVAWTVMKDLKQRYDTDGTVPTKAAFYKARDQHVFKHRAEDSDAAATWQMGYGCEKPYAYGALKSAISSRARRPWQDR